MKKIGVLIMSLMLVSSLFLMAGCQNGTTEDEKVVAEQYRGTFAAPPPAIGSITISEKSIDFFDGSRPAYTIGNTLYWNPINNGYEIYGTFLDANTLHDTSDNFPTTLTRQ